MKHFNFLKLSFFIVLALILNSCNRYKQVSLTNSAFLEQKKFVQNYQNYVYVVHDEDTIYNFEDVVLKNDTFRGILKTLNDTLEQVSSKKEEQKKVHLFVRNSVTEVVQGEDSTSIVIPKSEINEARMYAKKRQGFLGVLLTILLVFVGLFVLLLLLIVGLLVSESGGGGSSGSSSNSDPNCYIATMVYGSNTAHEVELLRQFRDRVLLSYTLGKKFVNWYYCNSPRFVDRFKHSTVVNQCVKLVLNPIVYVIRKFLEKK